ncbi:hypothetical protein AVEN_102499-1, partial [Araneus ventricosus]
MTRTRGRMTELATPSPKIRTTAAGGRSALYVWRWVLSGNGFRANLEPFGPKVEILPLIHHGLLRGNLKSKGIDFYDDFLVTYLRRNKYRVKDAQQQILNLIHFHEREHVFGGVPDEYLDLPSSKYLVLLPMRCQDACALFLCRWGKWDSTELPFERLKQILVMEVIQALRDPMTQINGFKIIHDLEGMSFKQMKYCTPNNLLLFYNGTV